MSRLLTNDKAYFRTIVGVSIAIPVAVAVLFFLPEGVKTGNGTFSFLPLVNAIINSTVSVLLVLGLIQIKNKNIANHRAFMLSAFVLSALFLVSYVIYHSFEDGTKYGGDGILKYIYFFILITHILLSISIVPLVLITIYRSTTGRIAEHRKIAKWTFPIWLYVSVTGVLVYLLISPYYQ